MITMGADPEFLYKKYGKFYSAENVFGGRRISGKIGTDGHPQTAELRPAPFKDAIALTEEIQNLLKTVWSKHSENGVLTAHGGSVGGEGAFKPLCGHIHFNITPRRTIERLLPYLDAPMVMLLFVEDYDENAIRRRQTGVHGEYYGDLSLIRHKDHGFEYMTPSSWLISPALTRGYLSLYHALVYDFMKGKLDSKHPLTNVARWIQERDINRQFREAKHDVFRFKLKRTVKGIKELTMYKQNYKNYQSYINTLLSLLKNGKQWNESRDMFETWGLRTNEFLQKNLFFFQTRDYHIKDIVIPNLKLSSTGDKFPIRIFGLNDKKGFNISTNDDRLLVLINEFKKAYGTNEINSDLTAIYSTQKLELGIGRKLRESNIELVKELLKFIKLQYNSLIIN